jgi:thymidylate kinase
MDLVTEKITRAERRSHDAGIAASDFVTPISTADRPAISMPARPVIRSLLKALEEKGVRYCHWKSNIRLAETLAAAEDIDLLVDKRDAMLFQATLSENGFKLAQSRSGIGHPGVFHAFALDEASAQLVHLHAYFQIVSGDSLVKNYRLPIEAALLEHTRLLHAVRVPTPELELVLFALRMALKHIIPIEVYMANRHYGQVLDELAWLREAANISGAEALCLKCFPTVEPSLFRNLLDAIGTDGAVIRRIALGYRIARRLRGLRRLNPMAAAASRLWRVFSMIIARLRTRKDLALQTSGMIIALVGPKATGKSTIGQALAERLSQHLDVIRIHAGKPPATALSYLPRLLVPAARRLLSKERAGEYERPERRREKQYSLLYVLRMTLLAYDRRKLLGRALRASTAGTIVISDRYPSQTVGAIDSCCFDERALAKCGSALKRWLMNSERALYTGLPQPSLIVRLIAPLQTTIERDAQRLKEGGPDSEAVQRRWELETQAEFSGVTVIEINTDRPLDETVRNVVCRVWSMM